jgi:hypothetical protein
VSVLPDVVRRFLLTEVVLQQSSDLGRPRQSAFSVIA